MGIQIASLPELVFFLLLVLIMAFLFKKDKKNDTDKEAQFKRMKDRGTIK